VATTLGPGRANRLVEAAATLSGGGEILHQSHVVPAGVSAGLIALGLGLFTLGLLVRAVAWIKGAMRRSSLTVESDDRRCAGRRPAEDVPVPKAQRRRSNGRGRARARFE